MAAHRYAIRVTAVYAAVALLWIWLSDELIAGLPPRALTLVSVWKGTLFVLVTSVVLYVVVQRWTDALRAESAHALEVEERLSRVVEVVPVGLLLLDATGRVTFANPTAEELLDAGPAGGVGLMFADLVQAGPDPESDPHRMLEVGAADGLEIGRPGGSAPRAVVARSVQLDGTASGWVVAIADVTASHEQGVRARRLADAYRFMAEVTPRIDRASSETQLLADVCDSAVATGGFRAAWAFLSPGDRTEPSWVGSGLNEEAADVLLGMAREALGSHEELARVFGGVEATVRNGIESQRDEEWRRVGELAFARSAASFTLETSEGGVIGVVLLAEDSAFFDHDQYGLVLSLASHLELGLEKLQLDRRRAHAEELLERSERNYRMLFECNPRPMWVYDAETLRFLEVNDAAIAKYGHTREQFLAMSLSDIRPRGDESVLIEHLGRKNAGLDDAGFWTHRDAAGREFPVHIFSHDLEWSGRPARLVLIEEVARVDS